MRIFCMHCKKELQDEEYCYCNDKSYSIIYGNVTEYGNGYICECGNSELQFTLHVNANPKYSISYKCLQCGNMITIATYHEGYGNE